MRFLVWLSSYALLASSARIITFDSYTIGKMPPGWSAAVSPRGSNPNWEIRRDETAPTQPYVLAPAANGGHRPPLAVLDDMTLRDGDVSVRLKPVAGQSDPGGGVVWRYRDENNYYVVRTHAIEKYVAVYKVENGKQIQLSGNIKHEVAMNGWCILKVSARGNKWQIYMDHRRIMEGQDNTFSSAGRVGLWSPPDAVTYFDDFRVYTK